MRRKAYGLARPLYLIAKQFENGFALFAGGLGMLDSSGECQSEGTERHSSWRANCVSSVSVHRRERILCSIVVFG